MAGPRRRPLIGITGPRSRAWGPRLCVDLALRLAGARPIHLRPGTPAETDRLDGVVITGGHDVEPVLYRAVAEVEGRYDPERDAFELGVLDDALRRNLPLLAICRGAQLLNVRLGGGLVQDLTTRRERTSNRRTLLPTKTLNVTEGTRLRRCVGRASLRINSLHRQAIDRLGDGLSVSGRDRDEIVQAVELDAREFVLGVQWHPEFLIYLRAQRSLFRQLVRSAARHEERGGAA